MLCIAIGFNSQILKKAFEILRSTPQVSHSFFFCRAMAQPGSALVWGTRGPEFEPR